MTVRAWRLYQKRHSRTAFTGHGARMAGGRWNSPGVSMLYASQSLSLAAMELLVHLNNADILGRLYLACDVSFDASLIKRVEVTRLPKKWKTDPAPAALRNIGDRWAASLESVVLQVPSAVVEHECNFLFNPVHPNFKKIVIGKPRPFRFDPRFGK